MHGSYLGPCFSNKEIINYLKCIGANFQTFEDDELFKIVAKYIDEGKVVGWFSGQDGIWTKSIRISFNHRRPKK